VASADTARHLTPSQTAAIRLSRQLDDEREARQQAQREIDLLRAAVTWSGRWGALLGFVAGIGVTLVTLDLMGKL
jgi:hypothetical protein